VANGDPSGGNDRRDPAWWWKAAATTLLGLLATLLVKGCDEWQKTNGALATLAADVKYQISQADQRQVRLEQVERNLTLLYDKTVERFEQRREVADRILGQLDQRLDKLERYLPENSIRPPTEPKWRGEPP
jgi:hypothetical protein